MEQKMTNRDKLAIERRQQILDTSRRLFAANGYHATSMRAINKEVGMSEALTYHYFPGGKLEIFQTIIREVEKERVDDIARSFRSLDNNLSLREALLLVASKMAERFGKDREFMLIMIQERNWVDKEQMDFLELTGHEFVQALVDFLSLRAERGQVRRMDYETAVSQFMCHIGIIALQQILFEPEFDTRKYMKTAGKIVDFTSGLWAL